METELSIVVMAGVVLALFIIVGEIAALRKHVKRSLAHLRDLYRSGRFMLLALESLCIALFFLVQPVIIALLVAMVMDGLNPDFSNVVLRQLQDAL